MSVNGSTNGSSNGSSNGHRADTPVTDANSRPSALADRNETIVFENVSKFYGEVMGINHVDLVIRPGITSLVGPNGSGKSTLMNLMTGLLRPTRGEVTVLGLPAARPELVLPYIGYCTQYDNFPRGVTGLGLVAGLLRAAGHSASEARRLGWEALERVGLTDAAQRKVAHYSKGMRQRVKLATAVAHQPEVLILDEPLNGLDPMARAEMIALFRELAARGLHVIISSHILHEVDSMSDTVVLMNEGYVLAQGGIHDVRDEMDETHPLGVLVRCDAAAFLAARAFERDHVVEARLHEDGGGLLVRTRDADALFDDLARIVLEHELEIESVTPADDDVQAVYQYLIDSGGGRM